MNVLKYIQLEKCQGKEDYYDISIGISSKIYTLEK